VADLTAKLSGQRLFRVEVTRTFVGYVIADCETMAASFAPKIIDGDEDYDEDSVVMPTTDWTTALHKSDLTYHSLGGDITVAEYLAAKGGER
jgi:kynurenine formamidase